MKFSLAILSLILTPFLTHSQPASCDEIVEFPLTPEICAAAEPTNGDCCTCDEETSCEGCFATVCPSSTTTENPVDTTADLTTTDEPCETDADEDFVVDYIGKSTQFRIYNQCDDKQFLKIKMTDLTEYDSDDKKTTNKVTGFASTDWEWDNPNGQNTVYNGYKVVKNTFTATDVISNADFILTTYLFKEDAVINDNNTHINVNSLKFNVEITDWPFLDSENYLQLCINLMTNKGSNDEDDEDNGLWRAGEFEIETFDEAKCGDNDISVNVTDETNGGGNQRNLCFTFGVCGETEIFYDPIVRHVNEGTNSIGTNIAIIVGSIFGVLAFIGVVGLVYWFVFRNKARGPYKGLLDT